MQIPSSPPDFDGVLQALIRDRPERFTQLLSLGLKPDVDGQYLHWDELRRRPPPAPDLTSEDWWVGLCIARNALRRELPLTDNRGRPFHFMRTDGLHLALSRIDRAMGGSLETANPQIASRGERDRYIVQSLIEEAITSSQLEGASTTRRVAKEMLLTNRSPRTKAERMILNNFRAMELIRAKVKEPLSVPFLLELHEVITAGTLEPGDAGRLRRADEAVIVQDNDSGGILHNPPAANELPARLEALCAFANADSWDAFIHPVVRAITLHFAFAYNHPFVDGNGRSARALFYWSLLRQDYWMTELLSISRVILKAPAQYGRAFLFTETDGGDVTYFLLHQVGVIQQAIDDLFAYLDRKSKELEDVEPLLKAADHLNHRQRVLLAHALRHPGATYAIEPYRREHGVVYQTARQDLLDLEKEGYVRRTQVGRAFRFSVVPELERVLRRKKAGRGQGRREK